MPPKGDDQPDRRLGTFDCACWNSDAEMRLRPEPVNGPLLVLELVLL
jgi:hypothetical protein